MAAIKSDVATDLDSTNPSVNKIEGSILKGRVREAAFSFDTGATPPAVGEKVDLVDLPAGARVWSIYLVSDALSSGAGTAGMDVGDDADPDRFVTAQNLDAAFQGWLTMRNEDANLKDKTLGIGFKYTSPTRVKGTVTGEAFAANARATGYIIYSVE